MVSGQEDAAISPDPIEDSHESEPSTTPPVLAGMRIERDATADGRTVLYYSWPTPPSEVPNTDADV